MTRLARSQLVAGNISLVLPIRPYTAQWSYQHNTVSRDTIGGRVVQLLSVNVSDLTIESVAGSRRELQRIADGVRDIMAWHVKTSRPAIYTVPSRGWKFRVYVNAMPQIGWDVAATTYPYSMTMSILEDLSGVQSQKIRRAELERLSEGIGYNPHVHGGDAQAFSKLVESVLAVNATTGNSNYSSGSGGTGPGANKPANSEAYKGDRRWPGRAADAPWDGRTLRDAVYNAWEFAGGRETAERAMCIVSRESGWNPETNNGLPKPPLNSNGSWDLGLHQINTLFAGHRPSQGWAVTGVLANGVSWWPDDYHQMFDPEYNTRCAIDVFQRAGNTLKHWETTAGPGGC